MTDQSADGTIFIANTVDNRGNSYLAAPFDELANDLKNLSRGRKIVFLQNSGNFGDSLIRYGTLKFFEDHHISYREIDMGRWNERSKALLEGVLARFSDTKMFVYAGSGAWADACRIGQVFTRWQYRANPSLFILPTTFQHYDLPIEVPVFTRDTGQSARVVPHAKFCHDMAFYLALILPNRVLSNRIAPKKGLGIMFRSDNEARGHGLTTLPGNCDLSALGHHLSDPKDFLRRIDEYEAVLTDRLHIAIGACILGKKVFIVPGNYFKIMEIWRASMDGVFENCEIVSDERAADLAHTYPR